MTFDEYQQEVMRTCGVPKENKRDGLLMNSLGLASEVGEITEHIKHVIYHGHDLDLNYLKKELGDLEWYICSLAAFLDLKLSDVVATNITKLRERYPDGFSSERSINRKENQKT